MAEQHGYRNTSTYSTWMNMRRRCRDPRRKDYHNYGGRGISVCKEWNGSFKAFLQDMGERPEGKSIERIDNNRDYCKSNCVWADNTTQLNNTRFNRIIEFNGKSKSLSEWAKQFKIDPTVIPSRLSRGWSIDNAITLPAGSRLTASNRKLTTYNGETHSIKKWCKLLDLDYQFVHGRLRRGWSFEDAVEIPKLK